MEKSLLSLYQNLQKLTGLHRNLLEVVRKEREVLVQVNLIEIKKITQIKQDLLEKIHQAEMSRIKIITDLAVEWKQSFRKLTLSSVIIRIQGEDPKGAEQFRSLLNVLTILIQRISTQNKDNQGLVESSLSHFQAMKKNALDEKNLSSTTYTSQGQKASSHSSQRLLSREA